MDNTCVICGAYVPEGRLVCPACERKNGCTSYEQANTAQYQRQSGWKEPPEPYCPVHTRYVSFILKSPYTTSYKAARKSRLRTAFRKIFDFLDAFFISRKRRKPREPNDYRPGQSKGRGGKNDHLLQFRRWIGTGGEKGTLG